MVGHLLEGGRPRRSRVTSASSLLPGARQYLIAPRSAPIYDLQAVLKKSRSGKRRQKTATDNDAAFI